MMLMERAVVTPSGHPPCPCCNCAILRPLFTKKARDFWRCRRCGYERVFPAPTLEELKHYYDRSYRAGLYRDFLLAEESKRLTARARFAQIQGYCRPGRWLDVGCSNGLMVQVANQAGMQAEGIDLSEVAILEGRGRSLSLVCSSIEDFHPPHRFDTITCFDVLEHVLDPVSFLNAVRRLLVPGVTVCISVPDQGSLIRKLMGRRWYFYIPEEHLHYFNAANLQQLLRRTLFEPQYWGSAPKVLTYRYAEVQFHAYNPLLYALLNMFGRLIPEALLEAPVRLHIGELIAVARTQNGRLMAGSIPGHL